MKSVIAFVALILGVTIAQPSPEYYKLDEVPGVDFVGFGFDARFEEPKNALTLPLLDFAYTKGKTYVYPTDPDRLMRVPDEIYVRTVAYTEATAVLQQTIEQTTMALAIALGFNIQDEKVSNDTAERCVTKKNADGTNNSTSCESEGFDAKKDAFSIGANVAYNRDTFDNDEATLVENTEKTQLYNLFLDTQFIREDVKNDIVELGEFKFDGAAEDETVDPQKFFNFIEKYGTHYIVSAVMGGQVRATSYIKTKIEETSNKLGISASVDYVSSQDALSAGKNAFLQTVNFDASFGFDNKDKKVAREATMNWFLIGGDSNSVNLLDTRNSSKAILKWKPTIVKNPVPVGFRLREIGTLFSDFLLRGEMSKAVSTYLTTEDTSDIISVTINLKSGGYVQNAPSLN